MVEEGLFRDERIELLQGLLTETNPQGPPVARNHCGCSPSRANDCAEDPEKMGHLSTIGAITFGLRAPAPRAVPSRAP